MALATFPIATDAISGSGFIDGAPSGLVPVKATVRGKRVRTAGDIISSALKRILVQGADAGFAADEYADGLDDLNDYMMSLEADGIVLGYSLVDNVSDIVTVPAGAYRGIVANLAIEVAPDYNGTVSEALVRQAREGMKAMEKLAISVPQTAMPTTLPYGSGDFYGTGNSFYGAGYYTNSADALLSLAGNQCLTDFTTNGISLPVAGFWRVERSKGLHCDITGKIRALKKTNATIKLDCVVLSETPVNGAVMINNNDYTMTSQTFTTEATTPLALELEITTEMEPGEYLTVSLANLDSPVGILMSDAQWSVK